MRLLLVSEVVEDEEAIIAYLHDRGIVPGTQLALVSGSSQPDESDAVLALADGSQLTIPCAGGLRALGRGCGVTNSSVAKMASIPSATG